MEAATGKRLAPRSLRPKRKYLEDCTDAELEAIGIDREKKTTKSTGW